MIIIGNNIKTIQSDVDSDNVAINPTRAECAVDNIIKIIGVAHTKPTRQAMELILATIICICFATKLSVAPTWFNISNSCLCNIAMFRDMHDTQTPIDTNINNKINVVMDTSFHPAEIDVFKADVCAKNFARGAIFSLINAMSEDFFNFTSNIVGK